MGFLVQPGGAAAACHHTPDRDKVNYMQAAAFPAASSRLMNALNCQKELTIRCSKA
jgi:hypothetical protein